MKKKHIFFTPVFLLVLLCCAMRPVIAQCTFYPGNIGTSHVGFEYYSGGTRSVACSAFTQSFFTSAANVNNLPKLKIDFLQPDDHPGFRAWALNTTDSISIKVNDIDYPLTAASASIISVFTCAASAGNDAAIFANNYLVGTDATSSQTLAYVDVMLNTTGVNTIEFYSRSGAGWGFAGALSNCTIVPVTLVSFKATHSGRFVLLQWSTSTEINTNYFEIETSGDAIHWQGIGRAKAAGSTNIVQQYELIHTTPLEGNNYYRLKQVDADGKYVYSTVQAIRINKISFTISPNPFSGQFQIIGANIHYVTIINAEGKELTHKTSSSWGNISIDMHQYGNGIYFLRITDVDGNNSVQKLVKY